jgi:hypothetical protein
MGRLGHRDRVGSGERLFQTALQLFIEPTLLPGLAFACGVVFGSVPAMISAMTHHRLLTCREEKIPPPTQ